MRSRVQFASWVDVGANSPWDETGSYSLDRRVFVGNSRLARLAMQNINYIFIILPSVLTEYQSRMKKMNSYVCNFSCNFICPLRTSNEKWLGDVISGCWLKMAFLRHCYNWWKRLTFRSHNFTFLKYPVSACVAPQNEALVEWRGLKRLLGVSESDARLSSLTRKVDLNEVIFRLC